jgi:phosphoribosylamine--glycine ligase
MGARALASDALAGAGEGDAAGAAVGVVLASRGYPEAPEVGLTIDGLEAAEAGALVFHSGTAWRDGRLVTAGGRVLTVVGRGGAVTDARDAAYQAAGRVRFDGVHYRRDIGGRLLPPAVPVGRA